MQGQRGTLGSVPEMLEFDHGNTSSDAAIDEQNFWSGTLSPLESRIPEYIIEAPIDVNVGFGSSIGRERRSSGRWSLGEPSSRNSQGDVSSDERKLDFGWSASVDAWGEAGMRLEERRYEPTNNLALDNNINNGLMPSSDSDATRQNLNLNVGFSGHGGDTSQVTECPVTFKFNVNETEQAPHTGNSDHFLLPASSTGFLLGESDGRPSGSSDCPRASHKRKRLEGNLGQSSLNGSCSYFPHTEIGRLSAPAHLNAGINISSPSQERNRRLGTSSREVMADSLPDSNVRRSSESTHRNFRVRLNPSNQQRLVASGTFSSGRAARHSSGSSSQISPGVLPVDQSLELRTAPVLDTMSSQNAPVVLPVIPQNVQALGLNSGPSSRTRSLSSSVFMGERDTPVRENASSRSSMARQILGRPIFVPAPELRSSARLSVGSSSRNPTGTTASVPGNVASTSRTGPSSSAHPSSGPSWSHHGSHPQFPRRLSEYVRRSLIAAGGSESGNQGSNLLPMRSGSASSQEAVHTSGAANPGHHHPHSRSAASWLERHGDELGHPYSLQALAAGGEGSNRLVSEIRNVLGLMRRGENVRFEDIMLLDHSMLFGVADIHDRHRDMRLDVDNMSYEELLALEEQIGDVNTGLSEEKITNHLKHKSYIAMGSEAETETEPCCVCQEEYNEGDDLGMLECGHDFHSDCIKQWLTHKNLCPICKTTALAI